MRRFLALFLSIALFTNLKAQDSLSVLPPVNPEESFKVTKMIAPAALMSVGAFGAGNPWWKENINEPIKEYAADLRNGAYFHADDYIQYIPAAAFFGIALLQEPKHEIREIVALEATSWIVMGALVNTIKYTVKEMRPDGSKRNSFPSGHTATAIMGAELVRLEYGPWWGAGAYAIALGVAGLRVYNERHWPNDLLGGAAIGILSANAAYWLLPLERKILGWDKESPRATIAPSVTSIESGAAAYGVSISLAF